MKQYCRYCAHLVTGNGIYCEERQKELAETSTKRVNNCKSFDFNPIDAYDLTQYYKPREKKQKPQPLEYYDGFDFECTKGW